MKDLVEPKLAQFFIENLFGDAETWVEFLLTKQDASPIQRFYHGVKGIDWQKIYEHNRNGYNVFYSPCGRSAKSGKKTNVSLATCLWVDIDDVELAQDLDKIYDYVEKLDTPDPSYVVASGHGLHIKWLLDRRAAIDTNGDRTRFEGYLYGLATHLKADMCWDASRRLRLPESINWKHPNEPVSCYIVSDHIHHLDYRRPQLADFDRFYAEPPSSMASSVTFAKKLPQINVASLQIPANIKELITNPPEKGGRSEAAFKVVQAMLDAGYNHNTILSVFMSNRIGERYAE
jgi:hypothetical protein